MFARPIPDNLGSELQCNAIFKVKVNEIKKLLLILNGGNDIITDADENFYLKASFNMHLSSD